MRDLFYKRYRLAMIMALILIGFSIGYLATERGWYPRLTERPSPLQSYPPQSGNGQWESRVRSVKAALAPGATLIEHVLLQECGKEVTQEHEVSDLLVGLDLEAIHRMFPEWEIIRFEPSLIEVRSKTEGICNQRMVTLENGKVVVYYGGSRERALVKEVTEVSSSALLPEDIQRLRQGLVFTGKDGADVDRQVEHFLEGLTNE